MEFTNKETLNKLSIEDRHNINVIDSRINIEQVKINEATRNIINLKFDKNKILKEHGIDNQ